MTRTNKNTPLGVAIGVDGFGGVQIQSGGTVVRACQNCGIQSRSPASGIPPGWELSYTNGIRCANCKGRTMIEFEPNELVTMVRAGGKETHGIVTGVTNRGAFGAPDSTEIRLAMAPATMRKECFPSANGEGVVLYCSWQSHCGKSIAGKRGTPMPDGWRLLACGDGVVRPFCQEHKPQSDGRRIRKRWICHDAYERGVMAAYVQHCTDVVEFDAGAPPPKGWREVECEDGVMRSFCPEHGHKADGYTGGKLAASSSAIETLATQRDEARREAAEFKNRLADMCREYEKLAEEKSGLAATMTKEPLSVVGLLAQNRKLGDEVLRLRAECASGRGPQVLVDVDWE